MSQAPSMPMYWDAYLADTTHLTTEEHGAYLLLLAAMWRRNGSVPDDDKDNARILGLSPAKWRKIKARFISTISGFSANDGLITQRKLKKTWENTQEKIATNRSNGLKGGRPKSNENNDIAKPNGYVLEKPIKSIPEPEPDIKKDTKVSQKRATRLPDDWFLPKEWGEWALGEGVDVYTIRFEADQFKDYWAGIGGQKGTKLNWEATWRNWIRRNTKGNNNGNRNNGFSSNRAKEKTDRLLRIVNSAAAGTSTQDWSTG